MLRDVTKQFDQTPYHKGGHKLGEGGFGEVFYCRLKLSGDKQETLAVKVLNKLVGIAEQLLLGTAKQMLLACLLFDLSRRPAMTML